MYHEIVILGVLLSILFYEFTGYSPAGMIVAGYMVLSLQTPMRIVYTLLIVLLTVALARLLSRFMILYGRRLFAVMILLSFLLDFAFRCLPFHTPSLIGNLIPGIIAQDCEKQGILITLLSLAVLTAILTALMLLVGRQLWPAGAL